MINQFIAGLVSGAFCGAIAWYTAVKFQLKFQRYTRHHYNVIFAFCGTLFGIQLGITMIPNKIEV